MGWLSFGCAGNPGNLYRGGTPEMFGQVTDVSWGRVLNDCRGHAGLCWHMAKG